MKKAHQMSLFSGPSQALDEVEHGFESPTESLLAALAVALGARDVPGWSPAEERLIQSLPAVAPGLIERVRDWIVTGHDPLGELFCSLRKPAERRSRGATYTPFRIVKAMLDWASGHGDPERVVDPGAGSGRFAVHAGRRFPRASLLGIESDPLPAMIARANLAASGFADRSEVVLDDYRGVDLRPTSAGGKTLFIGNPPYVRHHLLDPGWKQWLVREATRRGLASSQLAGMHVHFFLATVLKARPGDFGTFITAAEWLDVNYGCLVRELFLNDLGGSRLTVIEPTAMPFPDAASTAAIAAFEVGSRPTSIFMRRVETLDELEGQDVGREIHRGRLEAEGRWTHLTRPVKKGPSGYVELGELCRVHRGQVTGANKVWIAGPHGAGLPDSVLFATVTKAKELFCAGKVLDDASRLRRVVDLPVDLDVFGPVERGEIDRFLERARGCGAHQGYVATNRKAWWSVGLRNPAPILATYMARRPPAFVRNTAAARHLNIAHGLYPRQALDDEVLANLVDYLAGAVKLTEGRTYAGGLTKFEPREMERLLVPSIELLTLGAR